MLANSTLTECLNICLQKCTKDMNLMQICKDSSPVKTNLEVSKLWSCHTVNRWDWAAKLRAFTQQGHRKRLIVSMQVGFVEIATHCFKQWIVDCFNHYCSCEEARPALTEGDFQSGTKRRKWMKCGNSFSGRKVTLLSEFGNVIGENSSRLMYQWRNIWENLSHTRVHCVRTSHRTK